MGRSVPEPYQASPVWRILPDREPLTDKADREPCQDHQAGFLYPLPGLPGSGRQVEVGRLHLRELRRVPGRGYHRRGALAGTGGVLRKAPESDLR